MSTLNDLRFHTPRPADLHRLTKWEDAGSRLGALADWPDALRVCSALVEHVEQGWKLLAPLQGWYEANKDRARATDDYGFLLNFVDGDLTDLYLLIATGVANLIPGPPGWEADANPEDVQGWTDLLRRYMAVFRLACEASLAPEEFKDEARTATGLLKNGWCAHLLGLVGDTTAFIPQDSAVNWRIFNASRELERLEEELTRLLAKSREAGKEPPA